jgi:pyridine nucleotide-disulfide oxidoreductase
MRNASDGRAVPYTLSSAIAPGPPASATAITTTRFTRGSSNPPVAAHTLGQCTLAIAVSIDVVARTVTVAHGVTRHTHELSFDHLVLALGSVTNFRGLPGVAEHALTFKSLGDAMVLRNRMIDLFEQADLECCAEERRSLMTFVVAGAGFSGVELAAALWDFCHAAGRFYRHVQPNDNNENPSVRRGDAHTSNLSCSQHLGDIEAWIAIGSSYRLLFLGGGYTGPSPAGRETFANC